MSVAPLLEVFEPGNHVGDLSRADLAIALRLPWLLCLSVLMWSASHVYLPPPYRPQNMDGMDGPIQVKVN